jgi:hypothetical protein
MPIPSFPFASATSLVRALRQRKVSSLDLLNAYLERVDQVNPSINAIVVQDRRVARSQARKADEEASRGIWRGPINMITCLICLMLLFFETAFGICVGCKLFNLFNKEKAQLCPGNVCEIKDREPIQKLAWHQAFIAAVYVGLLLVLSPMLFATTPQTRNMQPSVPSGSVSPAEEERCRVPEFAKKIGHEEKWKLHNGC